MIVTFSAPNRRSRRRLRQAFHTYGRFPLGVCKHHVLKDKTSTLKGNNFLLRVFKSGTTVIVST